MHHKITYDPHVLDGGTMTEHKLRLSFSTFRDRFLHREAVLGTFIKTPTSHAIEILGDVGLDFVVIDEEHAPFGKQAIDVAMLAAKAAGIAAIVRVESPAPEAILSALDCGATGVLVPHVSSAGKAEAVASACRYRGGRRGFSNSPRAGGYGRLGVWEHVEAADAQTTVIAMIEDPEALETLDAIMAVKGLDGVFIGRGDLTVALGAKGPDSEEVKSATMRIAAAAKAAGKAVCAMTPGGADARWLKEQGVSAFIVSSDQGLMRQAALRTLAEFQEFSR
jgi:2-keto-3-deoxy-L-rhamnonate aldolase RhmA